MSTIIFVHGMYLTGASWRGWQDFFEARGHTTLAPSWPGRDGEPAALRADPPAALEALTLPDVVQLYREAIAACDAPPILIGHSMGGLVTQILLQEKQIAAAVAIDSAPPKGVFALSWSFLKANAPHLGPGSKPVVPTLAQWRYAFDHTLSTEAAEAAFAEWVVPESKQVGKGPTTAAAQIDFAAERPPLLLVAGEDDHIIPAALNRKNHARYAKSPSRTDLKVFAGRTHWICMQDGWQEVAGYVADWLDSVVD